MKNSNQFGSPIVSVIMNCLNCAKYLREAINSVFTQTYTDWEIIFWDNASTDNSEEIAKSYGEKVRYFRSDKTYPLGKARNLAMEKARGKYIAFLDCDDIWMPEKLERQLPLFYKNSEIGLVFSNFFLVKDNGDFIKEGFRRDLPPRGYVFRELLIRNFVILSTATIRKDCLERTGLFDPRYNLSEEYDLFLRIARLYHFDYILEPLARYRVHEESWGQKYRDKMREETISIFQGLLNKEGTEPSDIHSAYLVLHIDKFFMDIKQLKICDSFQELSRGIRLLSRYGLNSFNLPSILRWFASRIKNQLYFPRFFSNKY